MTVLSVAIRVEADTLDPDEIESLLGIEADEAHRRGDPNVHKSGRRYRDHSLGLWAVRSNLEPSRPLGEHLQQVVERLSGCEAGLCQLAQRGYTLSLLVGIFEEPGNFELRVSHELLVSISKLSLSLDVDIYCMEDGSKSSKQ